LQKLLLSQTKQIFEYQFNLLITLLDPGWRKIRIWDKHPGSATLKTHLDFVLQNPFLIRKWNDYMGTFMGSECEQLGLKLIEMKV